MTRSAHRAVARLLTTKTPDPARPGARGKVRSPPAPSPGDEPTWTPAPGEVGIRVRMYRVGFGDFFLLSILDPTGRPQHVVIDCGVFKGTSQTGDIESIEAAVANLIDTTAKGVSLIVMTHRHADHIAGFARCQEDFKSLHVQAVWMPIWESEYEPTAVKFQAELTRTAQALRRSLTGLARATDEQNTARKYMENATGDTGTGSNAQALALLKQGFPGVTPRYYKGGDKAELPKALADAGLSAVILGPPPIDDIALMKLMDLQKGVGQYLAPGGDIEPPLDPFGAAWEVNPSQPPTNSDQERYASDSFREWIPGPRKYLPSVTPQQAADAREKMRAALKSSLPAAEITAAKQLNSFLNNQSLVILFSFKGKNLLFVGDAQAGNWEHWLFGTDTPDSKPNGSPIASAQQILTSLDFYKVGHHGSGNATPRVAADAMGTSAHRFAAMCSTQAGVYGTEDPDDPAKGTEVPRGPLLQQLASKSAFVRSDQIDITVGGRKIPAASPQPLPGAASGFRFVPGPLWVDCYL